VSDLLLGGAPLMRRSLALLLLALGVVALATWLAGEQTEVAVLRTFDAAGAPHDTKLWVIDVGDTPWVRVASRSRAWYQRLLAEPRVELVRGGRSEARLARPSHDETVGRAVDEAFAEKYGPIDAWYGVLLRRDSVPIRLEPAAPDGPAATASATEPRPPAP
jgi:hypothetical protein